MEKNIKVLIWGTGKSTRKYLECIKSNVEILAFVESNPSKEEFMGKKVISPKMHVNYDYDFVFVFSIYANEIRETAIQNNISEKKLKIFSMLEFSEYSEYKRNHFHERLKKFNEHNGKIEMLCTGISYHNDGINPDMFPVNTFNFALRAQDLFFDFSIIKYLITNKSEKLNLKYVLLGLNYYSFEYDFSKSSSQKEIVRYFPEIPDAHNLMENDYYPDYVKKENSRLAKLSWYGDIFDIKIPKYEINDNEGQIAASADFDKHYPITLYENVAILKEMISYLQARDIIVKILIMPAPPCYTKYCPSEKKILFKTTLNEVLAQFDNIQVLDCFENYECSLDDYYHVTHFNKDGATKFSKYLSKLIEW